MIDYISPCLHLGLISCNLPLYIFGLPPPRRQCGRDKWKPQNTLVAPFHKKNLAAAVALSFASRSKSDLADGSDLTLDSLDV